jgi:hypothetical protein
MKRGEERRNSFHGHETSGTAFTTPRNEDETHIEELKLFIGALGFMQKEMDEKKDREMKDRDERTNSKISYEIVQ